MQPKQALSLHASGSTKLERLWRAVHGHAVPSTVTRVFDLFVPPDLLHSAWPSQVSDDHTPYEFSLLLGGVEPEVRILAEALPTAGASTLGETLRAGQGLRTVLETELGADFQRFDRIADLFLPREPIGTFALWYGASFDARGLPSFKVYLNPAVQGAHAAPRLVEEALDRLGFRDTWSTVARAFCRGRERDELRFLSLDLSSGADARVKVYGFLHDAPLEHLLHVASTVPGADLERVARFVRAVAGGDGVLSARHQPATCLAFAAGETLPRACTVHVPVRAFAGNDAAAHGRVLRALAEIDIPSAPYESAVEALAARPLDQGSGLLAWAALRTGGERRTSTVYLAPLALADEPSHAEVLPSPSVDDPEHVVRRHDERPITDHPFFARLEREPFNGRVLAILVLNMREAITLHFARRLASVVARVEEDPIRSILAKQLNDELGNGDPSRTHKVLFDVFANGVKEWLTEPPSPASLEPGRVFGAALEELYLARSPYEGLGATLIMEVLGKQADLALGKLFRRNRETLPAPVLEWLVLHEELEHDHVDESHALARMIPAGPKKRLAARGAAELWDVAWAFLDAMYHVCFARA
ncbi:iron-containing redox enzyme family protein [Polyangium sp. 6x1]|uniref:iron-containing redox enzyme family protein n=1 Tax=Polyangium sp. 6x1 TaxID=3042689 RepID=UPI00248280C5|nr:iron-containing redox enzyme family protein [Polyangium sp. 6x1]MDI1449989.1 iron-containing redox enzyme family protein [Polyangium sp. 6x1]